MLQRQTSIHLSKKKKKNRETSIMFQNTSLTVEIFVQISMFTVMKAFYAFNNVNLTQSEKLPCLILRDREYFALL